MCSKTNHAENWHNLAVMIGICSIALNPMQLVGGAGQAERWRRKRKGKLCVDEVILNGSITTQSKKVETLFRHL